jgi:predicted RNA-binding Zn-ribbon protein involved in translation (DUF1610 family)
MSLGLYNRIKEALAQPPDAKPVATLICPKCGVDRFKSPCGNASHIMTCPLQGVALAAPQPPAGKGERLLVPKDIHFRCPTCETEMDFEVTKWEWDDKELT